MSNCAANCLCACDQHGCGCHIGKAEQPKPLAAPMIGKSGATKVDPLCDLPAHLQQVKTPAGNTVDVIWCPRCDVVGSGR